MEARLRYALERFGRRPAAAALSGSRRRRWWHYLFCRSCRRDRAPCRMATIYRLTAGQQVHIFYAPPRRWVLGCDPVEYQEWPT